MGMDANVSEVVVGNGSKYADLVNKALEVTSQPINWNDLQEAAYQIIAKIMSLISLGLPVIIVFFGEVWAIKVYVIEKHAHIEGLFAWLISLMIVLLFIFPLTVAIFLPIVADLLSGAGVSG